MRRLGYRPSTDLITVKSMVVRTKKKDELIMVTLYHATTADNVNIIMAKGFCDYATVHQRGPVTYCYWPGVWLGDVPVLDDELFDNVGLFGSVAENQTFIAIEFCLACPEVLVRNYGDHTWPGTQYWGEASVWNQFPRARIALDEIIRLRLAGMRADDIETIRKHLDRPYDSANRSAFTQRVRNALALMSKKETAALRAMRDANMPRCWKCGAPEYSCGCARVRCRMCGCKLDYDHPRLNDGRHVCFGCYRYEQIEERLRNYNVDADYDEENEY